MARPTRRPKRAAKRHAPRALTEVTRLVRLAPFVWAAEVTYAHGLSEWSENVRFAITPLTESVLTVEITDADYPKDRKHHVQVPTRIDFVQFVHDYLIAGRW